MNAVLSSMRALARSAKGESFRGYASSFGGREYINASSSRPKILERISELERGLLPAIAIKGEPVSKNKLAEQMEHYAAPAVSIAVINEGAIEWAKSYGFADPERKRAATISSLFQAGSISKPVAAFGALALVQKGVLDLNGNVNLQLKSWKIPDCEHTATTKITLKHLLSHSSGVSVMGFDGYATSEKIPTLREILNGAPPANNPPLHVEFEPGKSLKYSSGGFAVVQRLVEDVTDQVFSDYMKQSIFDPLGMTNSTMSYPLPPHLSDHMTSAYTGKMEPILGGHKIYPASAAVGLWSTPIDISKWLIHLINSLTDHSHHRILEPKLLKQMMTRVIEPYGLGPVINGTDDRVDISHYGRTDGFACEFVAFPYLKKGAVVMINSDSSGFCLVDEMMKGLSDIYQWPAYKTQVREEIESSSIDFAECPGRYCAGPEKNDLYDIEIEIINGKLAMRVGTHSDQWSRLHKEKENKFFLTETGDELYFHQEENRIYKLKLVKQAGYQFDFNKLNED